MSEGSHDRGPAAVTTLLDLTEPMINAYGQNNYRTLGASDVRRVAASLFMKNRLIVFERAAAANAPTI